jgi:hypothetical protein
MPITTENAFEETNALQLQQLNARSVDFQQQQQQEWKKQEAAQKIDEAKENVKDAAGAAAEYGQLKAAELKQNAEQKGAEFKQAANEKIEFLYFIGIIECVISLLMRKTTSQHLEP